jgi:toxin FitB
VSGYLVDTNVISTGAPGRADRSPGVVRWMEDHTELLYLSVITIAEIEAGVAKASREGASNKASRLSGWLEGILHLHADRVLPIDISVARIAGRLTDVARSQGLAPGFADIAIAATATARRLTILTRNLRHFTPLHVAVRDPFAQH